MRLPVDQAVRILQLLLEGMSVRSVERVTAVHRDTILSLLVLAGKRCEEKMLYAIHALPVKDVQIDEIWGYVFKKEGHRWDHEKGVYGIGDCYTFVGIERHTKLILAYHVGKRDADSTEIFIAKLAWATSRERYQLTSDGFKPYIPAIKGMLKGRVDFGKRLRRAVLTHIGEACDCGRSCPHICKWTRPVRRVGSLCC
jgi:hypothetical protein